MLPGLTQNLFFKVVFFNINNELILNSTLAVGIVPDAFA